MKEPKPCENCGLLRTASMQIWLDAPDKRCFAQSNTVKAVLACNKLTIARLRKQIEELEQRVKVYE